MESSVGFLAPPLVKDESEKLDRTTSAVDMTQIKLKQGHSWLELGNMPPSHCFDKKGFEDLWSLHPEHRTKIKICGRESLVPRWHKNFGARYSFSGIDDIDWDEDVPEYLQFFLDFFNRREKLLGREGGLNQVLLNWYWDGGSYIGNHRDNENGLVGPIVTISFGATRKFVIRSVSRETKEDLDMMLANGGFLCMCGGTNEHYKHGLPKMKIITGETRRVSVTLRRSEQ